MKRALLVTAGTVAGLVSVLAYSPLEPSTTVLSEGPGGGGLGLGAPPAASPVGAAGPDAASAAPAGASGPDSPGGSSSAAPVRPSAVRSDAAARPAPPAGTASRPGAPRTSSTPLAHPTARSTAATSSAPARIVSRRSSPPAPAPTTRPAPRPTPKPTPRPTPTPVGPKDYTGSAVTYKYGTLQVAIRVIGGRITDAWAVAYPMGSSQPYSEMAIPILRSQTISAQSAHIAGATGASLTSTSWITSLGAALAAAGLR